MNYRFQKGKEPGTEAVRIFRDTCRNAVTALQRYSATEPEELHTARKEIKKLRSLLRLLRSNLPHALAESVERDLRKANRRLSGQRDLEALAGVCQQLSEQYHSAGNQSLGNAFQRLRTGLIRQSRLYPLDPVRIQQVTALLEEAERVIRGIELPDLRWNSLRRACRRQGRRVKHARSAHRRDGSGQNLHAWRKQCKHYLHHLRLLSRSEIVTNSSLQRTADTERLLGHARDLSLLLDRLSPKERGSLTCGEHDSVKTALQSELKRVRQSLEG
jgi:CHAD domain-containing protein